MKFSIVNSPPFRVVEEMFDLPEFPNPALAVLAGYLRHKGVDVQVVDCKMERLSSEEGIGRIKQFNPDVVGFTAMTHEIKPSAEMATKVKAALPSVFTVVGGVHHQAMPEHNLREFPQFDYGSNGESQETLLEMLGAMGDEARMSKVQGACFINEKGEYVYGGARPTNQDLDEIWRPAWDMFPPAKKYVFQSALGCPYNCNFCANPWGRKVRRRNPALVAEEIAACAARGKLESFQFGDETFTLEEKHATAVTQALMDKGVGKPWFVVTHIRGLSEKLLRLMKKAGCYRLAIGVETGDGDLLKSIGKGLTLENIAGAAKLLRKVGMPFETLFILGHPNENRKSAWLTVNFAVKLNPSIPIFGVMVPFPGTEVRRLAAKNEGGYRKLSSDWNDYNKHVGDAVQFKNIQREELERIALLGYLKVFLWNFRFIELTKFVWRFRYSAWGAGKQWLRRVLGLDAGARIHARTQSNSAGQARWEIDL
jgi:anaerobic magnesium-protoporphyrin IX monomethyl ester cyclase